MDPRACLGWLVLAAVSLASCTSDTGPTSVVATTVSTSTIPETTIPATTSTSLVPDTRITLSLPPGIASTSATFEAPDPATHYFDVLVVFPVDTVLRIHFTTADGIDLRILTQEGYATWCLSETGLMRCLMHLPILEARQAGIWTAVVVKLSGPPAEVTIDISWMSLQPPVSG